MRMCDLCLCACTKSGVMPLFWRKSRGCVPENSREFSETMRSKSTVRSVTADLNSAGFPPPCRPSDSPSKLQRRVARCQHRDVCIVLDADRQPSIQAPPASQCRGSAQRLPTRDAKFRGRCQALQDTQEVHDLCRSHHSLMIFFWLCQ